jgi:glycosyltransferase involved in cell wall biosynthesis
MKLLLISTLTKTLQDSYYHPVEGHVRFVANELAKRGHDVWVVALKGTQPEEFKIVEVEGDEGKAFEIYKKMLNQFDVVMDFSTLKYTYVHKHDEMPKLKLLGPCYPYQAISYQTAPPIPHPCFIATSDSMAQAMSAKIGCMFKVVHYFPLPIPNGFEAPKERNGRLLYLGRFEKTKGIQIAVDLARQLNMGIDVAGEDLAISDQRFTVLLLQKADGRLIRVFGRVNEALKHELLAKAKAVVLPYLEDSIAWTGQVALEAFQYGTPIITMNKGCMSEIVKDGINGFLCERLDQLPEAVKRIDEIKPEACVETAKQFSLESAVSKYQELLRQVSEGYEW